MRYTLKQKSVESYNETPDHSFPKYTTQLMNLANQISHGTRPPVVGQLSDLFQEYLDSESCPSFEGWRQWYVDRHPDAFSKATEKICAKIQSLQQALSVIDQAIVEQWVEDLIVYKTFNGLYVQKAILASLAEQRGETYRLATPAEESKGIDGFVGETPYSIKPDTYKTMGRLSEIIDVKMIYYTKTKTVLKIEVED